MQFWDYKRTPSSVRLMVEFGRQKGLDDAQILKDSGVLESQLEDPHTEIQAAQELQVISNLQSLLHGQAHLGMQIGLHYRLSTFGIWGYGIISSATGLEAMALALRYQQLTFIFTQISYHEEGENGVLVFNTPDLPSSLTDFLVERDMAASVEVIREVLGSDFFLKHFMLKHKHPHLAEQPQFSALRLLGVEPTYGTSVNAIAFDRALLMRPLLQANPITAAMCEQMCRQLMDKRLTYSSTSALVQQYLLVPGSAPPDLPTMAKRINISERTLRRRLQEEQVSYSELLLNARRSLAEALLSDMHTPLLDITERLGYSDLSTFSQAFKRWTNQSPSAYRKQKLADLSAIKGDTK